MSRFAPSPFSDGKGDDASGRAKPATASARKACSAATGQVTLCLCHRTHPKEN